MTDDDNAPELSTTLSSHLATAIALARVAQEAMPAAELRALSDAVDFGRVQIACTLLMPSGAVRVHVVGEWPGEKTLWELLPDSPIMRRPTQ